MRGGADGPPFWAGPGHRRGSSWTPALRPSRHLRLVYKAVREGEPGALSWRGCRGAGHVGCAVPLPASTRGKLTSAQGPQRATVLRQRLALARQRTPGTGLRSAHTRDPESRTSPRKRPRDRGHTPALTLAAALPDLGAQAAARDGHVPLLQAQAVLLFRKPRGNAGGKTATLQRHLRKNNGIKTNPKEQILPRKSIRAPNRQNLPQRCLNAHPRPRVDCSATDHAERPPADGLWPGLRVSPASPPPMAPGDKSQPTGQGTVEGEGT